jgi:hypothetical protein
MANFSSLKQAIETYIKQNGNKEITGALLQSILLSMVTTIGDGAVNDLESDVSDINGDISDINGALTASVQFTGGSLVFKNANDTVLYSIAVSTFLDGIVARLNSGAVYAGYAAPSTTPDTLAGQKVFYVATQAGTYIHFLYNGDIPITLAKDGIYFIVSGAGADDWNAEPIQQFDDVPTPNSNNPIKSGAVLRSIIQDGSAFDLSAHNAVGGVLATYADLSEALTALNSLDAVYKQPGMSFKFVQTDDNKYVQFRLMAQTFSTNEGDWQGVDTELVNRSHNLIENGVVYNTFKKVSKGFVLSALIAEGTTGTGYSVKATDVDIPEGSVVRNIGAGAVTLCDNNDITSVVNTQVLAGGKTIIAEHDYVMVRGRSDTDLPFKILVYIDKDVVLANNGMTLKEITDGLTDTIYNTIHNESRNLDINAIARFTGMTGTGYSWIQEVNIPAGVVVRNIGEGKVTLYDIKDYDSPNRIAIDSDKTIVTTFDISWIRGSSETNLSFDLIVYADKNAVVTDEGMTLNEVTEGLGSTISDAFKKVSLGFNNIVRYTGTTGTSYAWRQDVDVPKGSVVRNNGTGNIRLYDVKNGSTYVNINGGGVIEMDFNATIIKANSATDLPYDLFVYADKTEYRKILSVLGKNIFTTENRDNVKLLIDGTTSDSSAVRTTDYLPVLPDTAYHVSKDYDLNIFADNTSAICFYDEDYVFISGVDHKPTDFTTPATCAYIRVCYNKDYASEKIMVNAGTERGIYEEYSPIAGYPDKNQEVIDNINKQITEITDYTTKSYMLAGGDNLGKFGTTSSQKRGIIPVNAGEKYIIANVTGNIRYAFVTSDEGGSGDTVPVVDGTSVMTPTNNDVAYITIPQGCKYLIFNSTPPGFTARVYRVIDNIELLNSCSDSIVKNTRDISAIRGKDGLVVKANDLSSDLTLDDFPRANNFGDRYSFTCKVSSFNALKIGHGTTAGYAKWFEINNTNIILYSNQPNANTALETVAHGLTIDTLLNINIRITKDGVAVLNIQTLANSFTHEFVGWKYDTAGMLQVQNDGSVFTNCALSAVNDMIKSPVWIFGASFESMKTSWTKQLIDMGYDGFYANAYPGRNGANTILDLKRALELGTPKYLYYSGSNDTTLQTYTNNLNEIKALCDSLEITLIVGYKADNLTVDYSQYRSAAVALGCRLLNNKEALQDPSITWAENVDTWYDGFMSSDGIHPTAYGFIAIAMQACVDIPEIMQYKEE